MAGRDKVRAELDEMTGRVQFVGTHLLAVMARLHGAAGGDGYPSGSGGGGGGASTDTPVERAAARRMKHRGSDPAAADLRRLEHDLAKAVDAVFRLEQGVRRYVTAQPTASAEPVRCRRCAELVTGKLRRDLCDACYTAWHRAGKPQVFSA